MVLRKSCRVWRKYRPRSVLLESKDIPDHVLLFESDVIASLSKSCGVTSGVLTLLLSDNRSCGGGDFEEGGIF